MKNLFVITYLILSVVVYGQDANFSQYNNSRLNTNPAFTGTDSALVVAANFRLQWPGAGEPYEVVNFSADKYIHALRAGLGINYLYDYQMQGIYTISRIEFNYAPHFELFHHKLVFIPAVQFAYFESKIDFSKLTYGDQIDPRRGFVYSTNEIPGVGRRSNYDLVTGILLYSKTFFAGIAVHHLTQPNEGIIGSSSLPRKFTIHGGINIRFKNDSTGKFTLSPTLIYMKQQDFHMLLPGITVKYKCISLGLSYRSEDAFITTLAFQNHFLRVGYSYDYTTSALLNKNTGGSHEIGLTYFLNFKKRRCNIRTLRLI